MGWLSDIFEKQSKDWFYSSMPKEQTPGDIESIELVPNDDYIEIYLKSMRIVNVRKGLSKFYATVHSHVELSNISGKTASFNVLTTPGMLKSLDAANIDRVINLNQRLLGPVPYRGDGLKLEVGLFSIKEAELAGPFINLLTDISVLGGVSFLSAALPYIKPLETGVKLLTGSDKDSTLEIGLNIQYRNPSTGYFVVIGTDKDDIKIGDIRIDEHDFKLVDKAGKAIKNFPYIVIEIISSKNRDDWYNIPEVSTAYNKLREETQKGDVKVVNDALLFFKRTVLTSPDLLFRNGTKLYQQVESDTQQIIKMLEGPEERSVTLKNLSQYAI
ncbi:hypothetical protein CA265_08290 [Sphingobacteriaceae bacterium GW460-11-11-14-LB5]|nr:hypothetical protein CA265_08290 [Sphingobacteriaceae bacterium GW460-11-11-14-LB5]